MFGNATNTLPAGNSNATSQLTYAMQYLSLNDLAEYVPAGFPIYLWQDQSSRYLKYWSWHTGEALEDIIGRTKDGRDVFRYPLKINPVRDFARKHAALLFGEVPDTPTPLVQTLIAPEPLFGTPSQKSKDTGVFLSNFVNKVWTQSNGRSIQYENGSISQFLGGSVFQIKYQPWRKDLLIPFTVKNIYPNYFLPLWQSDDYSDLLECWVVYLVDPVMAKIQWGIEVQGQRPVVYSEHWTKDHYTISVNSQPLEATYPNGQKINYKHQPNPFGLVPFVYIPRLREGSYYGSSLIPDIEGLAYELNARAADEGDAMRKTVHQKYTGTNITGEIKYRKLDENGNQFIDLGNTSPMNDETPEIKPLEPPKWDKSYSDHKEWLRGEMLRNANLGPIAYGEDEGSQRSALTLAFRMWPSTIIAKAQRTFWTDGMIQCAKYILRMAQIKGIRVDNREIPADFEKTMSIVPQWLPMIPRDREALNLEVANRLQSGSMSPEHALEVFADTPDKEAELKLIKDWLMFLAKVEASKKPPTPGDGGSATVKSTGLGDDPAE